MRLISGQQGKGNSKNCKEEEEKHKQTEQKRSKSEYVFVTATCWMQN